MRIATLCLLLKDDEICLALKKRGFGEGKYNGFGGKVGDKEEFKNEKMWDGDKYWMPKVLAGDRIKAKFDFDENGKVVKQEIGVLN